MSKSSSASSFDHFKSIIQLPFMVTVVIPILIYFYSNNSSFILFEKIPDSMNYIIGILLLSFGLTLFILSIQLFIRIGKGTLAPWNPTKNIVVAGLYRYCRNPMIIGVLLILLGESFLFRSENMLIWALSFFTISHLYFILKEEPDLQNRFGEEYLNYKAKVPRWIPRWSPWRPEYE